MTTTATASESDTSVATTSRGNAASGPVMLRKRIGSTMFIVNVRFSNTSNKTMEDKILRLIESEVSRSA